MNMFRRECLKVFLHLCPFVKSGDIKSRNKTFAFFT